MKEREAEEKMKKGGKSGELCEGKKKGQGCLSRSHIFL